MSKHTIIGYFGSSDMPSVQDKTLGNVTFLDLLNTDDEISYGVSSVIEDLAKLNIFPNQLGIQLLILATHVQAADTRISRTTESQDSWTRQIDLVVPVIDDVNKWKSVSTILERALNYLSGDIWNIKFRESNYKGIIVKQQKDLMPQNFDSLCLFSGGLDSLIAAVDLLEAGKKPLFISHASDGATSKSQSILFDKLKEQYPNSEFNRVRLWMSFPRNLIEGSNPEMTMRSRSFLFFALGVAAGTGFNQHFTLNVPENGLIALNVPLDPLRLGSHSTHTTHPFYMARWNELIGALGIDGELVNPYEYQTKGEMVDNCKNKALLSELIPNSLSCSSPGKGRWKKLKNGHCGYCLPCIIRRASIQKGLIADKTIYNLDDIQKTTLDTSVADGKQVRSFQLAIKRLKENLSAAKYLIYSAGPLTDVSEKDKVRLKDVYVNGLMEVDSLLASVKTEPSS